MLLFQQSFSHAVYSERVSETIMAVAFFFPPVVCSRTDCDMHRLHSSPSRSGRTRPRRRTRRRARGETFTLKYTSAHELVSRSRPSPGLHSHLHPCRFPYEIPLFSLPNSLTSWSRSRSAQSTAQASLSVPRSAPRARLCDVPSPH